MQACGYRRVGRAFARHLFAFAEVKRFPAFRQPPKKMHVVNCKYRKKPYAG